MLPRSSPFRFPAPRPPRRSNHVRPQRRPARSPGPNRPSLNRSRSPSRNRRHRLRGTPTPARCRQSSSRISRIRRPVPTWAVRMTWRATRPSQAARSAMSGIPSSVGTPMPPASAARPLKCRETRRRASARRRPLIQPRSPLAASPRVRAPVRKAKGRVHVRGYRCRLARLISSHQVETASITVVIKPQTETPPPSDTPICVFKIGPVSAKE